MLVSPHRTQRPWLGQVETVPQTVQPAFDPACYLCPGNGRAGGARNPHYSDTFVFENDYPALLADLPPFLPETDPLLRSEPAPGICRVVCFSPDHSLTLARMSPEAVRKVVDTWAAEFTGLTAKPWIECVQIFENRGEMMGASNPHPHGQIWATGWIPNELAKELNAYGAHARTHGTCVLCDYWRTESQAGQRVVWENGAFAVVVPYWAVWPFETLLIAKGHTASIPGLTGEDRDGLAEVLQVLTRAYDAVFGVPFPYTMGFHQHPYPHLHAHFYPPLLRSATVRKFMVGFEMLAMPQRDITAEAAAGRLRATIGL